MRKDDPHGSVESVVRYSVIVPVYMSEDSLDELYRRLATVLKSISADYEIIFVEDGGSDCSWGNIANLSKLDNRIVGIQLSRNYGQHNALLCGMNVAKGDIIITLDDDLQHPPEEIPKLLHKLSKDFDVVYGTPEKERHGFLRDLASKITKISLRSSMGAEVAEKVSAFRVFRASLIDAFGDYRGSFISIDVLLTWGTKRFASVSVAHKNRRFGTSNYNFRSLVVHAFNMITGFSVLPLQLASFIGFTFTFFGLIILIYVLVRYFIQGQVVPGFPFLASIIAIFSGAQLFALGIIGEYLARMHFKIMEKPAYTIRCRTES